MNPQPNPFGGFAYSPAPQYSPLSPSYSPVTPLYSPVSPSAFSPIPYSPQLSPLQGRPTTSEQSIHEAHCSSEYEFTLRARVYDHSGQRKSKDMHEFDINIHCQGFVNLRFAIFEACKHYIIGPIVRDENDEPKCEVLDKEVISYEDYGKFVKVQKPQKSLKYDLLSKIDISVANQMQKHSQEEAELLQVQVYKYGPNALKSDVEKISKSREEQNRATATTESVNSALIRELKAKHQDKWVATAGGDMAWAMWASAILQEKEQHLRDKMRGNPYPPATVLPYFSHRDLLDARIQRQSSSNSSKMCSLLIKRAREYVSSQIEIMQAYQNALKTYEESLNEFIIAEENPQALIHAANVTDCDDIDHI